MRNRFFGWSWFSARRRGLNPATGASAPVDSGRRLPCFRTAWLSRLVASTVVLAAGLSFLSLGSGVLSAATVPPGFSETIVPGPSGGAWNGAIGIVFEDNGRMYVWEGSGRIWFRDPGETNFTMLLDLSEEVGFWHDTGCLGFALHPDFRVNGYIYLLYSVDRHYLMNYGTPGYNPNTSEEFVASIGRITRYTVRSSDGFRSVDAASRFILLGETKETGFPSVSTTHTIGSLAFGEDGTLLASCGDGASAFTADVGGPAFGSYAPQGLADGIIKPKENIGAFRSQLVDSLSGKVVRLDPLTGNGVPSNPFYDPLNPRSAKSRVWSLGLRNPFRMVKRPDTGSHNPEDAQPGSFYLGDVGWDDWECLKIVNAPSQNFGWPLYEGLSLMPLYDQNITNQDAINPLYPGGGCAQYFTFKQLLKADSLNPAAQPPFRNPCNTNQFIPGSIPQFLHTRPALDWNHASDLTRTPIYGGAGEPLLANVGAGGSPVSGTPFRGSCAVAGTWYTGNSFPTQYQNTFFLADWAQGIIKSVSFDANDKPVAVQNFATFAGAVVTMAQNPIDGSLYYVSYDYGDAGTVRKLTYAGNRTPIAGAVANQYFGPTPLTVQFSSDGSSDPDGSPLSYSWNFGDGSGLSTAANPSHLFTAPVGVPTKFIVTLTVMDSGGLSAQTNLIVSLNNTPPSVAISSPFHGQPYTPSLTSTVNLSAVVNDLESANGQLSYHWQTLLRHNDHNHQIHADTNHVSSSVISPIGCDGINIYHYRVLLTVTDPAGLATTTEVGLYPDCGVLDTPPVISSLGNQAVYQDRFTPPLAFTIGDAQTAAANLQLSAVSSNPTLVPAGGVAFGGSSSNRTVTVTPALGQIGTATLNILVTDGPNTASNTFTLTVNPPPPGTASFTNSVALTISVPDSGPASPYPSYNLVTGLGGLITNLTVTLRNLTYTWSPDVDVLLVSPSGQGIVLCSDAGGGPVNNVTLTLSDAAGSLLSGVSTLVTGTFKPTNIGAGDTFAAPAPAGPYVTTLAAFNGQNANGAWALYFLDDGPGDSGSLAGGWSLTITTVGGSGSQAPVISDLPNQFTTINVPTAAIPFTVGDADTAATGLIVYGNSSNAALAPTNNMVFGGAGSNRTVTLTPATGQIGSATITVFVTDGTNVASDSFLLTVNPVNTPPIISALADQVVNEDTATGAIPFTINDGETAAGSLTLTKNSSNLALVPLAGISFGGSGSNRTVTVAPAANQSGTALVTVGVSDGQYTVSTNFLVTVNAVNDTPTLSGLANQTVGTNSTLGPLNFTVGDVETAASDLVVSGYASNPALVPTNNIVFGGSGSNRTVTITPGLDQSGTTTIILNVSDGTNTASTNFTLSVSPLDLAAASFTNATFIAMTNTAISPATPYPSVINVSGLAGMVSNVTVTLWNFSHAWTRDVDILLVAPNGSGVLLCSDAGNGGASGINLTFSDAAASNIPQSPLVTGTFRPEDYSPSETFPQPAPAGPFSERLSTLNGQSANGPWSLFVYDDGNNDLGSIAGGWTISLTTVSDGSQPPVISALGNQSVAEDGSIGPTAFTVGDADTDAALLVMSRVSSNPVLLPTNNIVFGGSGSNRTVTLTPVANASGSATITLTVSDGTNTASTNFLLTVTPVNDAPSIGGVGSQIINEDSATAQLNFTVGDVETPALNLAVSGGSSNPALVPTNQIVLGGVDSNRTVTVTPLPNASGTVTITLTVSDGTNSVSTNFLLTVNAVNDAPVLAPVSNRVVSAGQIVSFTNSASDVDLPAQVLTFSLLNFPAGATLDAGNGIFFWRPAVAQAGTTNLIELRVADDGAPVLSATQSFSVIVSQLAAPSVNRLGLSNDQLTLVITGDTGPDYTVQASPDLGVWTDLFTTNSPLLPFTCTITNVSGFPQRFFRVLLGP